jgi:hypothetical protein
VACPPIAKTKRQILGISNHENSDGLISIVVLNRVIDFFVLTSLQYDENSGPGRNYEVFCADLINHLWWQLLVVFAMQSF